MHYSCSNSEDSHRRVERDELTLSRGSPAIRINPLPSRVPVPLAKRHCKTRAGAKERKRRKKGEGRRKEREREREREEWGAAIIPLPVLRARNYVGAGIGH